MGPLRRTVMARLGGDKPSPIRAAVAAVIVGGITYKALRS
jgi:hypothetical protein